MRILVNDKMIINIDDVDYCEKVIQEDDTIKIERGYPARSIDPRDNFKLFEYFKELNKLIQ